MTDAASRLADVRARLKQWAVWNDEERAAGRVPTFLNPHTVLMWLEGPTPAAREHSWQFYMNGSFCTRCGAALGSGTPCQ